jgi:hypothetical protein
LSSGVSSPFRENSAATGNWEAVALGLYKTIAPSGRWFRVLRERVGRWATNRDSTLPVAKSWEASVREGEVPLVPGCNEDL